MVRRYVRKGRARSSWAPNIVNFNNAQFAEPGNFGLVYSLIEAPAQSTAVTTNYHVKNMRFSFVFQAEENTNFEKFEGVTAFVMKIPEDYSATTNAPWKHPEWILTHKFYGNIMPDNVPQPYQPYKFASNRNVVLRSGDKIALIITGKNEGSTSMQLATQGVLTWRSKAN